jgi:hypothetical protein
MDAISAHFDGSVIIPDEPLKLPLQAQVVVLLDSSGDAALARLEAATRAFYQSAEDQTEDDEWGRGLAHDSRQAWDEE